MAQIRELHSTSLSEPTVIHHPDMVYVPGGLLFRPSQQHATHGKPLVSPNEVSGFWMDVTVVTNADFARFAGATGYVTVAERLLEHANGTNAVTTFRIGGGMVFRGSTEYARDSRVRGTWRYDAGACWRAPEGAGSSIVGRYSHPVVQIAYEDALAYAAWAHKDLPSEAEWEFASRCNSDDDAAGCNEPERNAPAPCTLPVRSSQSNGYGLYEMFGNVWQWTVDTHHECRVTQLQASCSQIGPRGKDADSSPGRTVRFQPRKILKGGSYLCVAGCGCRRPTARHVQAVDTAACHVGFRCVWRSQEALARKGFAS